MDVIRRLEDNFEVNKNKFGNMPFNKYFRIRIMGTNKCLQTTNDSLDATNNKLVIKPENRTTESLNELWYFNSHPNLQRGAILCSACWNPKNNYNGEKSVYLCLKQSGNQLILYPINDTFRQGVDESFYFGFFATKKTNKYKPEINNRDIDFKKQIFINPEEKKNLKFINKYNNIILKYNLKDILLNIKFFLIKKDFLDYLNKLNVKDDEMKILSELYDKLYNIYIAFDNVQKDTIMKNLGNRYSLHVHISNKENVFNGNSDFSLVDNEDNAMPLYIDSTNIKYNDVEKDENGYSKDMITPFAVNMFCVSKTNNIYCNYVEELNKELANEAKNIRERRCKLMGIEDCSNTEQYDKCELYKLSEGITGRKCNPSMIKFHEEQCSKYDIPLNDCTREYLLDTQVSVEGSMLAGKKKELTELQIEFIEEQLKFMEERIKQERQLVIDYLIKTEKNIEKREQLIKTIIGRPFTIQDSPIDWALIYIMIIILLIFLYFLK
jgi:hypothetical protein